MKLQPCRSGRRPRRQGRPAEGSLRGRPHAWSAAAQAILLAQRRAPMRVGSRGRVGRHGLVVVLFAPSPQPAARGGRDAERDVGEPCRRAAAVGGEAAVAVGHEEDLLHEVIEIRGPRAEPRQKPRDERRVRDEELSRSGGATAPAPIHPCSPLMSAARNSFTKNRRQGQRRDRTQPPELLPQGLLSRHPVPLRRSTRHAARRSTGMKPSTDRTNESGGPSEILPSTRALGPPHPRVGMSEAHVRTAPKATPRHARRNAGPAVRPVQPSRIAASRLPRTGDDESNSPREQLGLEPGRPCPVESHLDPGRDAVREPVRKDRLRGHGEAGRGDDGSRRAHPHRPPALLNIDSPVAEGPRGSVLTARFASSAIATATATASVTSSHAACSTLRALARASGRREAARTSPFDRTCSAPRCAGRPASSSIARLSMSGRRAMSPRRPRGRPRARPRAERGLMRGIECTAAPIGPGETAATRTVRARCARSASCRRSHCRGGRGR